MKKLFFAAIAAATLALLCSCTNEKITMDLSSIEYEEARWEHTELGDHFRTLGFKNVEEIGSSHADEDEYDYDVLEVVIEKGPLCTERWEAGESFSPDSLITIYYNEKPVLTPENCPELAALLSGESFDYMAFAEEYDSRYVKFYAYVSEHTVWNGGTSRIIDVAGKKNSQCAQIRVGEKYMAERYNEDVEVGQKVLVAGTVDDEKSSYYKQLYLSTFILAPQYD